MGGSHTGLLAARASGAHPPRSPAGCRLVGPAGVRDHVARSVDRPVSSSYQRPVICVTPRGIAIPRQHRRSHTRPVIPLGERTGWAVYLSQFQPVCSQGQLQLTPGCQPAAGPEPSQGSWASAVGEKTVQACTTSPARLVGHGANGTSVRCHMPNASCLRWHSRRWWCATA